MKIDSPVVTSDKAQAPKRWVEVPQKDLFDITFPTIRINLDAYGPGKHYLTNDVADEVEDRVRAKERHDRRVMQRNPDLDSQAAMNRFGVGARIGHMSQNADAELGS